MIWIALFANFAMNFFLVRSICNGIKLEHTWYAVLGMVVFDLGKVAARKNAIDPFYIFLFVIAGMAGSVIGRNEAAKKKTSEEPKK